MDAASIMKPALARGNPRRGMRIEEPKNQELETRNYGFLGTFAEVFRQRL
jgi:hypothetical protein